ncbi:MAG: hypothetical protein MN733_00645 [Nitrososphaera sp.]|nr:hypothetical protein [Nitrososphaera sp.]
MSKSKTFDVIDYDVWGNEDDGYFVNDYFPTGSQVTLSERQLSNDNLLVKALAKKITFHKASNLEIDGDDEIIYVNAASTGKPLFELRLSERDS